MKRTPITVMATVGTALAVALATAAAVVMFGLYDVGATTPHTQAVYSLLETTLKRGVRMRAADIEPPPTAAGQIARGAVCYRDHCMQCHGGPGVAPAPVGMSMQPLPGPLVDAARRWREREIYWITRHGIRMSGMPAWELRLAEEDLWAVTRFVARLAEMSPAEYRSTLASVQSARCPLPSDAGGGTRAPAMSRPPDEGARFALQQYACVACHTIPGLAGSGPQVGPPLQGLARRTRLAGRLANTPDNLALWIRDPQSVKPGTAMPDLGVTEEHARQMAEYLWKLH